MHPEIRDKNFLIHVKIADSNITVTNFVNAGSILRLKFMERQLYSKQEQCNPLRRCQHTIHEYSKVSSQIYNRSASYALTTMILNHQTQSTLTTLIAGEEDVFNK